MIRLSVFLTFLFINTFTNAQCWKMIAPGGQGHTLAIKTDGTLWASGYNTNGQLGDSSTNNSSGFIQIGKETDWKSVSATSNRSYAIKTNGTLWSWGFNFDWQLGLGQGNPFFSYIQPNRVGQDTNWLNLSLQHSSTDGRHTLVTKTDNTLWDLYILPAKIGDASNWKTTSVSTSHTLGIKTDGTLWGWGYNNNGELGLGTDSYFSTPTQIGNAANWQLACAGSTHSLAIRTDGTLWATGSNNDGELGDGTQIDKNTFIQIDNGLNWKTIAAGDYISFATKTDGTIWAWGRDQYGELGIGNNCCFVIKTEPTQIDYATNWESVVAGVSTTFALKIDGSLWAWGYNGFGQIGDGTTNNKTVPVPVTCNSAVPIVLYSFSAQKKNNTSLLNWKTKMELNNKEYQLERSKDGIIFNPLATIISKNNGTGSSYDYIDLLPLSGRNYYRIKSIDKDDRFRYSNMQTLNFDLYTNKVNLFPNPVKNTLFLKTNFKADKLSIVITDLEGRRLLSQSFSNNMTQSISTVGLKPGVYLVTVSDGVNFENKKIIKENR